eukprot:765577-Hanusia_phi.AAC.4
MQETRLMIEDQEDCIVRVMGITSRSQSTVSSAEAREWKRFLPMRTILYGKKAANLYTQAFVQNTQARALYQESEDTYYRANDAASYDDWRRARHQWDYFYNRH